MAIGTHAIGTGPIGVVDPIGRVANAIENIGLQITSLIVATDKTAEGRIIQSADRGWFEIVRLLNADWSAAFKIPPDKWEEIIAAAYKVSGFDEVTLTHRSGDLGRDVIAIKHGIGSVRVINQVKAYHPSHRVPANDVRALCGILDPDGASLGVMTTTSSFAPGVATDPLIGKWISHRLQLVDGPALLQRLRELLTPQG